MDKREAVYYDELLSLTIKHLATGPFPKCANRLYWLRLSFWKGCFWLRREVAITKKIDNIVLAKMAEQQISKPIAFEEVQTDLDLIKSTWGNGFGPAIEFLKKQAAQWQEYDREH